MLCFCFAAIAAGAQSVALRTAPKAVGGKAHVMKAPVSAAKKSIDVPRDDEPVYDPEGTDELYIMKYVDSNGFMDVTYTNGKVTMRTAADGKTVWFNGLTPGGNRESKGEKESWLKGERNGNDITIKAGQVLVKNDAHTLYLQVAHLNDYGEVTEFETETHFTVGEDGSIAQADSDDWLVIYKDSEEDGYFSSFGLFNGMSMQPIGELTRWEFPEGSNPQTYTLKGNDLQNGYITRLVKVAFVGDKCYISGLAKSSLDEVYEGTYRNDTVTIAAGQIVKDADLFYFRIMPAIFADDGDADLQQDFVFEVSKDKHTLTLAPSEVALCETNYAVETLVSAMKEVSLSYYAGDVAAKPATPEFLTYDEQNTAFYVNIPATDVDGNYINADKLTYRFYVDGAPFTFTPDTYVKLTESMTDIPYNFADNYDFYSNPGYKVVCFYNLDANYVELESTYTVDGVATSSDRARYTLVEDGISAASASKTVKATTYANLLGQRVARPAAGSIVLKTVEYTDGTKATVKQLVK